jgi:hypothetical protein
MNLDFAKYQSLATRLLGRGSLYLRKYSPEILMGAGVVGVVVGTVMACKATLRIDEVTSKSVDDLKRINEFHGNPDNAEKYTEEEYKKDILTVHVQRIWAIGKLYLPAATVGIGALACILGSHGIMSQRQVSLLAAYKLIDESFKGYRKRVTEKLGEDGERAIRYDLTEEKVTETTKDENGKKVKTVKTLYKKGPFSASMYARYFNNSSVQWQKSKDHNIFFLKCVQNHFNDRLKATGNVFLNEVYDALGIPRSQEGAMVGWVLDNERDTGDNYIDFGIFSPMNQDYINHYEVDEILLDFNVDGEVYDLI